LPALAVEDGLDAVDAAIGWLVVGSDFGFVGAPEMGDVGPGLRLDLQLVLGEDRVAALGDRVDPAVDIEDDGGGRAIFGDADGIRRASGRKRSRKQVRSLLAGPVTAASMAVISWSRVAVGGQACAAIADRARSAGRARRR